MSAKTNNLIASLIVLLATSNLAATLPARSSESPAKGQVTAQAAAKVGAAAPDFTLTDSNGKQHSLSQDKGKVVVLEWINFECPFVKKHYDSGNMQKLQDKYTKKGVVWLSINSSAKGKHGNYAPKQINEMLQQQKGHQTAYLSDENGKVGRSYGATATPHMFIIDPKGTLVYAGAIDSIDSTDIADIKTAKNYVSAALDEVIANQPVAIAKTQAYGCSIKY